MTNEELIPKVGVITNVRKDTPDVKTFPCCWPLWKKVI